MKIKPIDNVYFGAHLPQKQKDKNMKESTVGHNGRMVDKSIIVDGLCEIKDVLSLAEDNFIGKQDSAYYQEVIEAAKDYLLED